MTVALDLKTAAAALEMTSGADQDNNRGRYLRAVINMARRIDPYGENAKRLLAEHLRPALAKEAA